MLRKRKPTKREDAMSIVGEELAVEMDEEEKKQRKKGKLSEGMIYKFQEGILPSHIVTMEQARNYQAAEERLERMGEQYGVIRGCLENIWNSGASVDVIAKQTIRLFQEAAQYILGGKNE